LPYIGENAFNVWHAIPPDFRSLRNPAGKKRTISAFPVYSSEAGVRHALGAGTLFLLAVRLASVEPAGRGKIAPVGRSEAGRINQQ